MPPTMPYNFERFIPTNKTSWTCTAAIYMAVIEKTCFFKYIQPFKVYKKKKRGVLGRCVDDFVLTSANLGWEMTRHKHGP